MAVRVSRSFVNGLHIVRAKAPPRVLRRPRGWNAMTLDSGHRREVGTVTLRLPMPPSKNELHIWTSRGPVRSPAYVGWLKSAKLEALIVQRAGCVKGHYALYIKLPRHETGVDLGNIETPVSDFLQEAGIIENDRLAEHVQSNWGADTGIIVTVVSTQAGAA